MEKKRQTKIIAIVALVIAISAMTIGFAAFSATLNIFSSATITPNEDDFSIQIIGLDENHEYTSLSSIYGVGFNGATAGIATIKNGKEAVISGLSASFIEPGQSVSYSMLVWNDGLYDAYITSTIELYDGMNEPIMCVPSEGSDVTEELMNKACESIDIRVLIYYGTNNLPLYEFSLRELFSMYGSSSLDFGSDFVLPRGENFRSSYVIEYASDGVRADGPFIVKIANIKDIFSSALLNS